MGKAYDFKKIMKDTQKELDKFLNEIEEMANLNATSIEEELQYLNPVELEYLEGLEKKLTKLQEWKRVNNKKKKQARKKQQREEQQQG